MQIPWQLLGLEEARCKLMSRFLSLSCIWVLSHLLCDWVCVCVCVHGRPLSLLQGILYHLASPQRVKYYTGERVEAGGRGKGVMENGVGLTCRSAGSDLPLGVGSLYLHLWGWRKGLGSGERLPQSLPCHIISISGHSTFGGIPEPGLLILYVLSLGTLECRGGMERNSGLGLLRRRTGPQEWSKPLGRF